jgi:hypothetical protein
MFITKAHRVPITTFNTLNVQERGKLSAYVSYIYMNAVLSLIVNVLFQIGIYYFGQDAELRGCINDANNMQNFICSK